MTSQQVGQQASQPNRPGLATTQGKLHLLVLISILISYAILSLYQIDLPGLHYDEAFEAVPALQLLLGQPVTAFRNRMAALNARLNTASRLHHGGISEGGKTNRPPGLSNEWTRRINRSWSRPGK